MTSVLENGNGRRVSGGASRGVQGATVRAGGRILPVRILFLLVVKDDPLQLRIFTIKGAQVTLNLVHLAPSETFAIF